MAGCASCVAVQCHRHCCPLDPPGPTWLLLRFCVKKVFYEGSGLRTDDECYSVFSQLPQECLVDCGERAGGVDGVAVSGAARPFTLCNMPSAQASRLSLHCRCAPVFRPGRRQPAAHRFAAATAAFAAPAARQLRLRAQQCHLCVHHAGTPHWPLCRPVQRLQEVL